VVAIYTPPNGQALYAYPHITLSVTQKFRKWLQNCLEDKEMANQEGYSILSPEGVKIVHC
jgi:hypothetical protein